jgi:hypothetical protein
MEHPLITNLDQLSVDDLASKISDLQQKLGWAIRMNHGHLAQQITMALESYQNKYREKLDDAAKNSSGFNFNDKINIK